MRLLRRLFCRLFGHSWEEFIYEDGSIGAMVFPLDDVRVCRWCYRSESRSKGGEVVNCRGAYL